MSDLPDNQQNSNRAFEPDSMSADAHPDDATPADGYREEASETTEAFPSGFHEEPDGQQGQPTPFKTSAATSPDLTNFLAVQRADSPVEEPEKHVFKVSPAEPDWSDYAMPPLDEPPLEDDPESGWKTAWAIVREVGETILLTLIIFLLIQTVIRNFRVVGTSMVDNLHDGQYLIIDKLSYTDFIWKNTGIGGPKRGDVVVFEPPNRPGEDYVKRIIGLPGETVEIKKGQVIIDGKPLAEPFQPIAGTYTMPRVITVPPDQVFVLGDNRNNSNDSHNWGTLPIENIVGRAWLSYWPPREWGVIPRDAPSKQATLKHFLQELVPGASADSQ